MTTTAGPADHYAVLGVSRDATADTIRTAYRERMRVAHPDAGGSIELAQALNEAHRVLTDPARRARYDATLPAPRTAPGWGTARPVALRQPDAFPEPEQPSPRRPDPAPTGTRPPPTRPSWAEAPAATESSPPGPAPTTRRVLVLPEPAVIAPPRFRLRRWAALALGGLAASAAIVGAIGVAGGAPVAGWTTFGLLAASVATGWWAVRQPRPVTHVIGLVTWLGCGIAMTVVGARTAGIPTPMILLGFVAAGVLSPARAERERQVADAARATEAGSRVRRAALEWEALLSTAGPRRVPRWVEHAVADDAGTATRVRLRSARGRPAAHVLQGLWPSGIWVIADRTGTVHGWATEEARRAWERFAQEVPA